MLHPLKLSGGGTKNTYSDLKTGIVSGKKCILDILYQTPHAWGAMWNKIYKADLFYERSFPDGKQLEDYKLITELYYSVKQIYFVSDPMYHWCMRKDSQSKKSFSKEKLTVIDTAEEIKDYFVKNCDDQEILAAANYFLFREYADVMWTRFRNSGDIDKGIIKKYRHKGSAILRDYLKTSDSVDFKRVAKCTVGMLF